MMRALLILLSALAIIDMLRSHNFPSARAEEATEPPVETEPRRRSAPAPRRHAAASERRETVEDGGQAADAA